MSLQVDCNGIARSHNHHLNLCDVFSSQQQKTHTRLLRATAALLQLSKVHLIDQIEIIPWKVPTTDFYLRVGTHKTKE